MIGILNAYHFDTTPGSYQEKYMPMTLDYFSKIMPGTEFRHYRLPIDQFPAEIDECTGYVVTGSPASCYEDLPWVKKLLDLIRELDSKKKKTFGICFGHQAIAHALGGDVRKSDKGWGIGVSQFDIIQQKNWMKPNLENNKCSLLFYHQDQVLNLPPNAVHLATNDFCTNHMYSISDHIFCVQGHPEFSKDYAKLRTANLASRLDQEFYDQRNQSFSLQTDHLVFGEWIKNFFSQEN